MAYVVVASPGVTPCDADPSRLRGRRGRRRRRAAGGERKKLSNQRLQKRKKKADLLRNKTLYNRETGLPHSEAQIINTRPAKNGTKRLDV